jgi:hypothetical protein
MIWKRWANWVLSLNPVAYFALTGLVGFSLGAGVTYVLILVTR